jgi:hypothetical protein
MPWDDFRGVFQPGGSSKSRNPIIVMIPQGPGPPGRSPDLGSKKALQMLWKDRTKAFLGALIPSSYRIRNYYYFAN